MTKITSDGTTASYYQLPEGATELQHLISYRNMNSQDGEIFRAIYRKGLASHSDELRDARKVLFYAQAEVERLEKLQPRPIIRELYTEADENRMDVVGQNGNTAEHYPADEWIPNNGKKPSLPDSDYEALQAECEKLRKDAERYRWLRLGANEDSDLDRWEHVGYVSGVRVCTDYGFQQTLDAESLDAAIDAAMEVDNP